MRSTFATWIRVDSVDEDVRRRGRSLIILTLAMTGVVTLITGFLLVIDPSLTTGITWLISTTLNTVIVLVAWRGRIAWASSLILTGILIASVVMVPTSAPPCRRAIF